MKLKEIIAALEDFAPPALQEAYDNAGLITGNLEMEIQQATLCLDTTEEVLNEAIETGSNLVISHHPVIFSGLKKITGATYVERCIIKAIKSDIAIYAAHTNLDNVHHGVNKKICDKLQLKNTKLLSPLRGKLMKLFTFVPGEHVVKVRQALFEAGAGVVGQYDQCSFNTEGYGTFRASNDSNPFVGEKGIEHREPESRIEVIFPVWLQGKVISALKENHPYEEVAYDIVHLDNEWQNTGAGMIGEFEQPMKPPDFLNLLKEKMHAKIIRHTAFTTVSPALKEIRTVAVCGGAGSFLLKEAIAAGADVFVSADFKYHQFFDAENKLIICDIGHYESEQFTPEIFGEVLKRKFPTFATRFTSITTNPINYY